jgi:hypothetical protein
LNKASTKWWITGLAFMWLSVVLGAFQVISSQLYYFMFVLGFLATIKSDIHEIKEKLT